MSGDRILSIKHRWGVVNSADTVSPKEAFKNFYDFVVNNPSHFTLVASHYGDGGTGFDHHDEANPPGSDPFFVFSMPSHAGRSWTPYFLVQGAFGVTLTGGLPSAVGGTACNIQGGTAFSSVGYIGMSCCVVTGGNPWNGGTAADGTDTKGDPCWVTPGGQTAWFFPRENAPGGAYAAKKESLGNILPKSGNNIHVGHFVADLDHLWFGWDGVETQVYRASYFGPYVPNPNVTVAAPFVAIMPGTSITGVNDGVEFGEQPIGQPDQDGGIAAPGGITVSGRLVTDNTYLNGANYSPNAFHDGVDGRDRYPFWLMGDDDTQGRGLLGHFLDGEIVAMVPQYLTHDDTDGSYGEVGFNANAIDWAWLVKWDGASSPVGTDRDGVQATVVVP